MQLLWETKAGKLGERKRRAHSTVALRDDLQVYSKSGLRTCAGCP